MGLPSKAHADQPNDEAKHSLEDIKAVHSARALRKLLTSRIMPTSSDDVPEWLKDHTYTISTLWADINNIGIHSIFIICLEMQEKGMHS
nr:peroxisome assembly protein 12-like [Biomphalaria glabrata]